ncbi:MAG: hypothetical protein GXO43_01340 [Crenarchaeota archaeon]|nr:hypothetical protein [Thermoproteota archaeon]
MGEEGLFTHRFKDYVESLLLERRLRGVPGKTISKPTYFEKPSPIIKSNESLFCVRLVGKTETLLNAIQLIKDAENIKLIECYMNFRPSPYLTCILSSKSRDSIWSLTDRLVLLNDLMYVDVLKAFEPSDKGYVVNPWLFPVEIGRETMSLIPLKTLCTLDEKTSRTIIETITDLIKKRLGVNIKDRDLLVETISVLGLGRIVRKWYDKGTQFIEITCGHPSEAYCEFIKRLLENLSGLKYKILHKGSVCLLSSSPGSD